MHDQKGFLIGPLGDMFCVHVDRGPDGGQQHLYFRRIDIQSMDEEPTVFIKEDSKPFQVAPCDCGMKRVAVRVPNKVVEK